MKSSCTCEIIRRLVAGWVVVGTVQNWSKDIEVTVKLYLVYLQIHHNTLRQIFFRVSDTKVFLTLVLGDCSSLQVPFT